MIGEPKSSGAKRRERKVRADRTVIVIGAFLSVIGLSVAWNGYSYILVERGPPMVIAGTIGFCAGLILIAFGFGLRQLEDISSSASKAALLLAKRGGGPGAEEAVSAPFAMPPLDARQGAQAQAFETAVDATQYEATSFDEPSLQSTEFEQMPPEPALEPANAEEMAPSRRFRLPRIDEIAEPTEAKDPSALSWMVHPETSEAAVPPPPPSAKGDSWVKSGFSRSILRKLPPLIQEPVQELVPEPVHQPVHEPDQEPVHAHELPHQHEPEPLPPLGEIPHGAEPPVEEPAPLSEWGPEVAARNESALDLDEFAREFDAPELTPHYQPEPTPHQEPEPELHREPMPEPVAAEAAPAPSEVEPAAKPDVIGHYEAHGAHYVMYADGSIDAQTAHGTYHFGSMEELKRFIEGQA
jgi:hypothetical protein